MPADYLWEPKVRKMRVNVSYMTTVMDTKYSPSCVVFFPFMLCSGLSSFGLSLLPTGKQDLKDESCSLHPGPCF